MTKTQNRSLKVFKNIKPKNNKDKLFFEIKNNVVLSFEQLEKIKEIIGVV